ncbi:MAG: bifunctional adenosylcobinamide kinase/adenosylcobinamide-phosphate guanylyltransferase [Anaerolineales bacterium]|nr:bifunctional adenosylcobinamide kinase/adenosylcobinamide-phosphate guanylyltransferase [Anaerolineales bacterium]
MGKLTLILGGARSGKSAHARRLAEERGGRVVYVATAEAGDDDMRARIRRHRSERPAGWTTLEIPRGVAEVFTKDPPQADVIVLDCITLLVSNAMLAGTENEDPLDESAAEGRVESELNGLLRVVENGSADWIVVTNEVGSGLVPPYPAGRLYRDLLGRANQRLAARAEEVYWMAAGIPLPIHSFRNAPSAPSAGTRSRACS